MRLNFPSLAANVRSSRTFLGKCKCVASLSAPAGGGFELTVNSSPVDLRSLHLLTLVRADPNNDNNTTFEDCYFLRFLRVELGYRKKENWKIRKDERGLEY